VTGTVGTFAGPVPSVATTLTAADRFGGALVRWRFRRSTYRVDPGLYAIGSPDEQSPVLATANYKLTFDLVRRTLEGRDAWLLVLDTRGINVWCAAGKGTFGTDELVRRLEASQVASVVAHGTVVVPQLGATGVSAPLVRRLSGFRVAWGPVRALDLPAFMDGEMRATPEMRRVRFPLRDRLVLVPVEFVGALGLAALVALGSALVGGIGPGWYSLARALERAGERVPAGADAADERGAECDERREPEGADELDRHQDEAVAQGEAHAAHLGCSAHLAVHEGRKVQCPHGPPCHAEAAEAPDERSGNTCRAQLGYHDRAVSDDTRDLRCLEPPHELVGPERALARRAPDVDAAGVEHEKPCVTALERAAHEVERQLVVRGGQHGRLLVRRADRVEPGVHAVGASAEPPAHESAAEAIGGGQRGRDRRHGAREGADGPGHERLSERRRSDVAGRRDGRPSTGGLGRGGVAGVGHLEGAPVSGYAADDIRLVRYLSN
jgi:hypothetical protein